MYDAFSSRLAGRTRTLTSSAIREILKVATRPDITSFAGGLPAPDLFPVAELAAAAERALSREPTRSLQYGPTDGMPELRSWIAAEVSRADAAAWRAAGLGEPAPVTPDMVMITTGSQQSLDLIGKLLIDDGDRVVVEAPSYLGALQAFTLYQPRYASVAMDDDGALDEDLQRELTPHTKLAYLLPTFQNPTGRTMGTARRLRAAEAVRASGVPLVEDDPYGALFYDGAAPGPSLRSLAPELTVALGTFSKTLAPGLRVGWLIGQPAVLARLIQLKQSADLHTSSLAQYVAYEAVSAGILDDHLERLREVYAERRDAMLQAIGEEFPEGVSWTRPTGGMFVWVTLPVGLDAASLLPTCVEQQRVAFVPGAPFHVTGGGQNTLRLNFTHAPPAVIRAGVRGLAEVLRKAMASVPA